MKPRKAILLLLSIIALSIHGQSQDFKLECDSIWSKADLEQLPTYNNGVSDFLGYCLDYIAPILSDCQNKEDTIIRNTYYVFTISSTGELLDVLFLRFGYSEECEKLVESEFMKMGKWNPGTINGENVCSRIMLPLRIHWN